MGVHWVDRAADQAVGKISMVVWMDEWTPLVHAILILLAYLLAIFLWGSLLPAPVSIAILASLPACLWAILSFRKRRTLVPSSLAMAAYMLAASIGWLLTRA